MNHLKQALLNYIGNPSSDILCFELGYEYGKLGQYATALSFYLKSAEITKNDDLAYESLICGSVCLTTPGSRDYSAKGILLHAVSLIPTRPEAYYFLSRLHESNYEWQEAYTMASCGLEFLENSKNVTNKYLGYNEDHHLLFQKSVASWHIGRIEESKELTYKLSKDNNLDKKHKLAIKNNLKNIGHPSHLK
jgi:tetratricopeptide (TPR) repeat protein